MQINGHCRPNLNPRSVIQIIMGSGCNPAALKPRSVKGNGNATIKEIIMKFTCLDCKKEIEFEGFTQQSAIDIARRNKWAVGRDRKTCYCPDCAPARRNVGKNGGKRKVVQQRIEIV